MGIKSMLTGKKPTAKQLGEELAKLEEGLAPLAAQVDRAEARAVETAADAEAYEAASAEAVALRDRHAALSQRVERLRIVYEEARACEQREHIARLKEESDRLSTAFEKTRREVDEDREAEKKRHEEAIADLERRENEAKAASEKAFSALHGLDLRERLKKAHERCNTLELQKKASDRDSEEGTGCWDIVFRVEQDLAAARREREGLEADWHKWHALLLECGISHCP